MTTENTSFFEQSAATTMSNTMEAVQQSRHAIEQELVSAQEALESAEAHVDTLSRQAERMYASGNLEGTDQVDVQLTEALAAQSRAEDRVRVLKQSQLQHSGSVGPGSVL